MRDLMLAGALLVFLPLALSNTFIAYLVWGWAGLAAINFYVYGFMQVQPVVQTFAIITLILVMLGRDAERRRFALNPTTSIFMILAIHALLCASLAYPDLGRNWEYATNMLKTILFCVLMPVILTSRYRIHAFVVMLAIATGFHGLLDGLKFVASGGAHLVKGIGKFGDNNHFALVLVMALPILVYAARYSSNKLVKLGFVGVTLVAVLAVIGTRSRGALACMIIVALWFILTSRRKFAGIVLIVVAAVMVVKLAPEDWSQRMNTIQDAGGDDSFMGRVSAWKVSGAIAVANPVFGGGFHAVQSRAVWERFQDAPSPLSFITGLDMGTTRAAHSIYFEVLGDLGFVGLFIFLSVLVNSAVTARTVMREALAAGPQMEWARSLAEMLLLTMVAYVTGGALLSAAYFEMPYIVCMLLEVLKYQVRLESGKLSTAPKSIMA